MFLEVCLLIPSFLKCAYFKETVSNRRISASMKYSTHIQTKKKKEKEPEYTINL